MHVDHRALKVCLSVNVMSQGKLGGRLAYISAKDKYRDLLNML
jgi:hypothetical protein